MDIVLYQSNAENNRVDKTNYLHNQIILSGTLKNNVSIIDPIILIEQEDFPTNYNYTYIPYFQRYYFINEVFSIRNKLWQLTCHVDVLFTWRANLANELAVIEKSQLADSNLYIDDGSFVLDSRKYNKTIAFPTPLPETGNYILIVAGGTQ